MSRDPRTVTFRRMKDGTKEDYRLLDELWRPHLAGTAERVLKALEDQGDETLEGYKVTRLGHALQAASRAHREGADVDWMVAALLHDIGDALAPENHDRFAAEVVRPYLREECTWVVEHHGLFQMVYYAHHYGWDQNAREEFKDHPCYRSAADFCERWDQASFDPDYRSEPLSFFAPLVREVFARTAYDPNVIRAGVVLGLPQQRSP